MTDTPLRRLVPVRLVFLAALVILPAGFLAHEQALRAVLADTAQRGENTLQLAATSLRGQMTRFENLPQVIADHGLIKALAIAPHNAVTVAEVNDYLKATQQLLGASDIYFMDATGITRAASNFDTDISFVGGDFGFRPYFTDAVQGGLGRYFALGTTSGKRGYYFGAPVRSDDRITGVLVVKIDLDEVEQGWNVGGDALIVTDTDGIISLSSRAQWLFSAFEPLSSAERAALVQSRRYPNAALADFPLVGEQRIAGQSVLNVAGGQSFLSLMQPLPEANWEIHALLNTAPARRQALMVAVLVMLALGLGTMALAVVLQRRLRAQEWLTLQHTARSQLEQRVLERTGELAAVNMRLEAEVAERRLAEGHLRQAQSDLVQAGKLAALGQMSAALSHEFNQPLGAARAFADNATVLIERGRYGEAKANLARILSLVDRMNAISKRLHSFARAPGRQMGAVSVPEAVEAAGEIAQLRLGTAQAVLVVDLPHDLPLVVAGPVRLQQVLVNLLTNAADAAEDVADRRIHLSASVTGETVQLRIRDHGAGVPPELIRRIFDPFFSTKGVGKGLGLGLSISYNIVKDFGGDLRVETAADGGAVFVIELRAAAQPAVSDALTGQVA